MRDLPCLLVIEDIISRWYDNSVCIKNRIKYQLQNDMLTHTTDINRCKKFLCDDSNRVKDYYLWSMKRNENSLLYLSSNKERIIIICNKLVSELKNSLSLITSIRVKITSRKPLYTQRLDIILPHFNFDRINIQIIETWALTNPSWESLLGLYSIDNSERISIDWTELKKDKYISRLLPNIESQCCSIS